jgi:hypothetical protein
VIGREITAGLDDCHVVPSVPKPRFRREGMAEGSGSHASTSRGVSKPLGSELSPSDWKALLPVTGIGQNPEADETLSSSHHPPPDTCRTNSSASPDPAFAKMPPPPSSPLPTATSSASTLSPSHEHEMTPSDAIQGKIVGPLPTAHDEPSR